MGAAAEAALQVGMAGASQGIGLGMGLLLERHNDKRQLRQQGKLTQQQVDAQKQLTDYNYEKQLAMWNATGYEAQRKQMEAAGINPALMYGMGGGGGQTANVVSGSVGGGHAQGTSNEAMQGAGMGIQIGLMEAQRQVLLSQAEKNRVEANKAAGVDTEEANTRIASLKQGIDNAKAQERLTIVEGALKAIEVSEKQMSQQDRMDLIHYSVEKIKKEMMLLDNEVFISRATMNQKVDLVAAELTGAILKNEATRTGIEVDKAQMQKWTQELTQGWTNLDRQERELKLKTFEATIRANYPGIGDVLGKQLNDALNQLAELHGERWGQKGKTNQVNTEKK